MRRLVSRLPLNARSATGTLSEPREWSVRLTVAHNGRFNTPALKANADGGSA